MIVADEACEGVAELFSAGHVDSIQGSQSPVGDAASPVEHRRRETGQMHRVQEFITTPARRPRQVSTARRRASVRSKSDGTNDRPRIHRFSSSDSSSAVINFTKADAPKNHNSAFVTA